MDRLERQYVEEAKKLGVELRVFTKAAVKAAAALKNIDALVIFTGKVSHRAKQEALKAARGRQIPIFLHHSCGVCTLRDCLRCLTTGKMRPS
jgi:ABC-type uncharacterized transport system substrate-binding protein